MMDNIFSGTSGRVGESREIFGADQWAFGYSPALQSLVVPPKPQFNMHGSSQMSYPSMDGQLSQGFSIDNTHGSQDPPSFKSQRDVKKKNVSRRGTAFTKEEDLVVCSVFLNISKDPITGVNQTSGGYYKRMRDYFNEHKPKGSNRSQIAIQHRWALIQKAMNKFYGHKEVIDRMNESRKHEQDWIDDAVQMYKRTEPFTIMHCWKKTSQ
ncbi:glutathione S-transferase T3-like [Miscanthus floridulus]|uniref:glutathione S-transferase T3-like n=1 Tax=Miscanthus floridulus TaxID=154761 RepID=UPI003457A277